MYRVLASSSRVVEPATVLICGRWVVYIVQVWLCAHSCDFYWCRSYTAVALVDSRLVVGFVHVTSDIVVTNG